MTVDTDDSKTGGAKTADDGSGRTADDVRRSFSALPFDEKISTLIRIELDMVGDAVEAVASAVSKALDEVTNACTEHSTSAGSGAAGQASTS